MKEHILNHHAHFATSELDHIAHLATDNVNSLTLAPTVLSQLGTETTGKSSIQTLLDISQKHFK